MKDVKSMKGELSGGTILIFMNFMPFMVENFLRRHADRGEFGRDTRLNHEGHEEHEGDLLDGVILIFMNFMPFMVENFLRRHADRGEFGRDTRLNHEGREEHEGGVVWWDHPDLHELHALHGRKIPSAAMPTAASSAGTQD
ncbi:MAG: hypothetical protein KFB96_25715 [Thiocapsa sp.]|uniref:hypothetical protein n=1 Tax=Thiocapsa sp. TaxID=2024551 RepID=UPI001BCC86DC|nr:hypothetical protein [Thiocapsa sp.]QVL48889.1 MAG: hypothetical protein KFB96_25715 [Thiocapsa sp.]